MMHRNISITIEINPMKIITKRNTEKFAQLSLVAGFGALWLTVIWYFMSFKGDNSGWGDNSGFSTLTVLIYYTYNSILLISLGFILRAKSFKLHSFLSLILAISVAASIFIFSAEHPISIISNLFFYTVANGMLMGLMFGGIILVPLFLFIVYTSTIRSIGYFRGKLEYAISEENIENKTSSTLNGDILVNKNSNEESLWTAVPYLGLFFGVLRLRILIHPMISSFFIVSIGLAILMIMISLFVMKNKNCKEYRALNIIILFLLIVPFLSSWGGLASSFVK